MAKTPALVSIVLFLTLGMGSAFATTFPYSVRMRDYSGYTPATQSDTNTTGMAGATVALPSSISSAESNPAGYAMQTGSISAQINRISIVDKSVQPDGQSIDSRQGGLGLSPPPWGFSLTYYSPITESGRYYSPNTLNENQTEVALKEFRATVARNFFDSRLALGFSAVMVKVVREIGPYSYNATAPSYRVGALYRADHHFIFGASYAPPLTVAPTPDGELQPEMPGFNRAFLRPGQLDLGMGWVPNRFFRTGVSISRVGDTKDTALLSDQSVTTGAMPSLIPRIGASYVLAQFSNFTSELAIGNYFATSRLSGQPSRIHGTFGLEANPYFINLGLGFDLSRDYHNIMIGVGVDIVRTLRTLDIIPKDPTPPYDGFLPCAADVSADGLPDGMTQGEVRATAPPSLDDVSQIVKEVPENIANKVQGLPTTVEKKEMALSRSKNSKKRKKGSNSGSTTIQSSGSN